MTRLRLTLRDESLADSAAIRQIDGVMGVIVSDEQFRWCSAPANANRRRNDERPAGGGARRRADAGRRRGGEKSRR